MVAHRLDCTGLSCPQPVIRTKDALEQGAQTVEVLVDNEAAKLNVSRFASSLGHRVEVAELDPGRVLLTISVTQADTVSVPFPEDCRCEAPLDSGVIYVISSDTMGRGSEELGRALLQTYIQTIKNVAPLPEKILLYNAGVRLVAQPSGALEALKQLRDSGVEILACGTCLDYYQLKASIQVGQISNMHEIMSSMASAAQVLSPY